MRTLVILLLSALCLFVQAQPHESDLSLTVKTPTALTRLPNKEVQAICQGKDGDLWICTRNGLFQYDSYKLTHYRSSDLHPDLLTSNNVLCAAEDGRHRLWIGTYSGLNVLDLTTGTVKKIDCEEMNRNTISDILVTRDGRILFATDWGLYEYREERGDFLPFNPGNTKGVLPQTAIKSLMEDYRGDLWIGTWNEGLFRHERISGKYIRYPRLNAQNSAHVLLQDSRRRVWVGTWNSGLVLLDNAYNPGKVRYITYRKNARQNTSISDDIIYALAEDSNTGNIWIGTRCGLSILPAGKQYDGTEHFANYYPNRPRNGASISGDEVTSLLCDRQGLMWLGMIGGGVDKIDKRETAFRHEDLAFANGLLHTSSVRSMLMDDENLLWLGIGSYGFGTYDRRTKHFLHYSQMKEFAGHSHTTTTVTSILQYSPDRHIWITAYDDGVYEIDKHASPGQRVRHYSSADTPWLPGECVYQAFEDRQHNLWFATRNGVAMRRPDGQAVRLDTLTVGGLQMDRIPSVCLAEDNEGNIWCGTSNLGVFRLQPHGQTCTAQAYNPANGKLQADEINCIHCDDAGRIWVGTNNYGLHLYDAAYDAFRSMHKQYNLPGSAVMSIRDDGEGNLWLGTDAGLLKFIPGKGTNRESYLLYTADDGLQDNAFVRGASTVAPDGELFFGGHLGYDSFYPEDVRQDSHAPAACISDLYVFNHAWSTLPDGEREAVSTLSPRFAEHIVLNHRQNNFTIEFSAMDHTSPDLDNYAYKLEGFDKDWQQTDASRRIASYNNLPAGTYTFCLTASGPNSIWSDGVRRLQVTILPPPWQTWWAYVLYMAAVAAASAWVARSIRNRIRLRNAFHIQEMEKRKVEELNHVKLQFFTNVTHEFLTPLSILQASLDELKRIAPEHTGHYTLMRTSINRLIRLLQQILEFRKAESGNLKLKVSRHDLAQFVRHSLESFKPLMCSKGITFACECQPERLDAYFDTDKVDKILYNLLSNASKYCRAKGNVSVELKEQADGIACLTVRDDGPGFTKSAQKELFKRFYEGDYRKNNTIGTGIGLSLVRDLATLHHGTIAVESEEGQGAAFTVTLPIARNAYREEEIDPADYDMPAPEATDGISLQPVPLPDSKTSHPYTLLLVENNHEMLLLLSGLLRADYNVHVAPGGKEGLEIMKTEHIDLIISDVVMEGMDGFAFCRTLRETPENSHLPIILLTARNREEDRIAAYESGADAFIPKPFNFSVLQARIVNLLQLRKRMEEDDRQLVFNVKDYDYTDSDQDFLQACIDCVNRHISEPGFAQARLAEEMHMSKSTLFRRLKQLTGSGVSVFISYIRIKTAARIIDARKNITITELSFMVGYNDPRYFSSCFKKVIGVTPSEYIRNAKQKDEKGETPLHP